MSVDHTVHIPKVLYEKFRTVQPILGYKSFAEYVRDSVREKLSRDEYARDRYLDKKIEEELNGEVKEF